MLFTEHLLVLNSGVALRLFYIHTPRDLCIQTLTVTTSCGTLPPWELAHQAETQRNDQNLPIWFNSMACGFASKKKPGWLARLTRGFSLAVPIQFDTGTYLGVSFRSLLVSGVRGDTVPVPLSVNT